jgi:colanic acid/amylovoran biosynthesis glycosyltransferase
MPELHIWYPAQVMPDPNRSELVILTNLAAVKRGDAVLVTRKFVEGMNRYAALWNAPVRCLMRPATTAFDQLDNIEVRAGSLPFEIDVLEFDAEHVQRCVARAAVIVGSVGYKQNHVSRIGRKLGIPVVYVTEYSLRTRLQVARSELSDPLRLAKRSVWEARQELRQRRALALAQGIQCNGTPTYEAYRKLTPSTLLYFDTRSTAETIATDEALNRRLQSLQSSPRLRLAFSGRLIPMKGAEHLVQVAEALRARNVDFELHIYGAGTSAAAMRHEISRLGLHSRVHLDGSLDFAGELMPRIRDNTDLFVCCHRQGDPSCTYLETLACGVPIVGYANEAWSGLLRQVRAGEAVPMNDIQALADCIARAANDKSRLRDWSQAGLRFAREHSFESTFARRIEHYRAIATAGVN